MVYECQACFTLLTEHTLEIDAYGKLICPSCGYRELKIIRHDVNKKGK